MVFHIWLSGVSDLGLANLGFFLGTGFFLLRAFLFVGGFLCLTEFVRCLEKSKIDGTASGFVFLGLTRTFH